MSQLTAKEIADQLQTYIHSSITDMGVKINHDAPFASIGMDSMAIIDLILFIERKFGVIIPEQELVPSNLKSIETLAACVLRNKN